MTLLGFIYKPIEVGHWLLVQMWGKESSDLCVFSQVCVAVWEKLNVSIGFLNVEAVLLFRTEAKSPAAKKEAVSEARSFTSVIPIQHFSKHLTTPD